MPESIGIQPWQVPIGSDPPAVKTDLKRLARTAAKQVNLVFADAAERDTILAAGGTFPPVAGMVAWLNNPGVWTEFTGTAWAVRDGQVVARRTSANSTPAGVYGNAIVIGPVGCVRGRYHVSSRVVYGPADTTVGYLQVLVNGSPLDGVNRFLMPANSGENDFRSWEDDIFVSADINVTVQVQLLGGSQGVALPAGSKVTLTRTGHGPFGL